MRRGSLIQLGAIGLFAGAICSAVALLIPWLPKPAGKEAERIDFTFWFTTWISIAVFSVVIAVLVYSVWKFRVRPDDDSDGPPTHGHTQLEIVWTAIPAVLVTAISIVSAVVLAQNSHAGSDPLRIKVTAQQFAWMFTYPDGKTYGVLRIPTGRATRLDITAKDVLHSFWVPQFGQKQDAVVGQHNPLVITPTRTGIFPVICTELCGLGHSLMRSRVEVMPPAKFETWLAGGSTTPAAAGGGGGALATYKANGCGGCHTYTPAQSNQQVGPSLDDLKAEAARAKQPLDAFVRQSIVQPGAYLEPNYQDIMPHTFGSTIQKPQLDELVQYLVAHAK